MKLKGEGVRPFIVCVSTPSLVWGHAPLKTFGVLNPKIVCMWCILGYWFYTVAEQAYMCLDVSTCCNLSLNLCCHSITRKKLFSNEADQDLIMKPSEWQKPLAPDENSYRVPGWTNRPSITWKKLSTNYGTVKVEEQHFRWTRSIVIALIFIVIL